MRRPCSAWRAREKASEDPIAVIATGATERTGDRPGVEEFTNHEGLGVQGIVDRHAVLVGRPRLLEQWSVPLDEELADAAADEAARGRTAVAVAWDSQARAVLVVADTIKATSAEAIAEFCRIGLTPFLLSGDSQVVADTAAAELGIEPGPDTVIAEVIHADKLAVIERLQGEGKVGRDGRRRRRGQRRGLGLAGQAGRGGRPTGPRGRHRCPSCDGALGCRSCRRDTPSGLGTSGHGRARRVPVAGLNDAAALAQADLGLAMGTGTDVVIEASSAATSTPPPSACPARPSAPPLSTIEGHPFWALAYDTAAIPLAAAGLLTPMIAGATMAFSPVFVVGNSLQLRRFRGHAI